MVNNIFGALYLRISRDKGENEDTLQNHREIMQDFFAKHSFTYDTYEEIVSGGKQDIKSRPQLQNLMANIGKYQAIFSVSLDRLSRNGLVSQQIRQLCIDHDIKIITPSQEFDLANKQEDRTLYDVSSMFAAMEYEMIGKRNKQNKMQRAKRGEWIASKPAFGYVRNQDTKLLEINEDEAKVVRYIFKLHGEGLGSRKIVDILNSEGYKPQLSNAFNTPTIKRIIQNPVYMGTVIFHNRKRVKEDGKYKYKTIETIETQNAHPGIVSVEEWEQANRERVDRAYKSRSIREKPAIKTGITMLKDLVFCGVCGRKMAIKKETSNMYSLKPCEFQLPNSADRCTNSGIKVEYLEEELMSALRNHRDQLQSELRMLEQADTTNIQLDFETQLSHVEAQINENQRQQNKLIELAIAGIFSHEELKTKKQDFLDQQQSLEKSKKKLLEQARTINVSSLVDQIRHIIKLLDSMSSKSVENQNESLKQFIKKIHYKRIMPEDIRKLTTRNSMRRNFPFDFEIEYF